MDVGKLSPGERIVVVAGGLLVLDLLLLPWFSPSAFAARLGVDLGVNLDARGVEEPGALWGIVALLVVAAMVVQVVIARLTTTRLPEIPIPWGQAQIIGAVVVFALVVVKLFVSSDFLGYGAWLGLALAGVLTYGAYMVYREGSPGPPPAPG